MSRRPARIAAHPIRKTPYNALRFTRVDGNGRPLYRVARDPQELGAVAALKRAFEIMGGHCFHCGKWMPAQAMSHECTRDHMRPRHAGGGDYLHNLVLACGPCNREKGGEALPSFSVERGTTWLNTLDEHLVRCIVTLGERVGE